MVRCVATCCTVLQRVVLRCIILHRVATLGVCTALERCCLLESVPSTALCVTDLAGTLNLHDVDAKIGPTPVAPMKPAKSKASESSRLDIGLPCVSRAPGVLHAACAQAPVSAFACMHACVQVCACVRA